MKLFKILYEHFFPKKQKTNQENCSEKVEKGNKPKEPTERELRIKYIEENKIPEDYVLTNLDLTRIYQYLHYIQSVYNIDSHVGYVPGLSLSLMTKIGMVLDRTKVNV